MFHIFVYMIIQSVFISSYVVCDNLREIKLCSVLFYYLHSISFEKSGRCLSNNQITSLAVIGDDQYV